MVTVVLRVSCKLLKEVVAAARVERNTQLHRICQEQSMNVDEEDAGMFAFLSVCVCL